MRPDVNKGQTRIDRACEEAVATKRCLGSLRYLWRNSKTKSHHPRVQELKEFLKDSPRQRGGQRAEAIHDDEEEEDAEKVEDEEGEEVEDESGEAGDENEGDAGEGGGDAGEGGGDDGEGGSGSEDSILRAPTLRLGDCCASPEPNSDGEWPDSQRPGAWISTYYSKYKDIADTVDVDATPAKTSKDVSSDDGEGRESGHEGDDGYVSPTKEEKLLMAALADDVDATNALAAVSSQAVDGESASESEDNSTKWAPFMDAWVAEIIDKLGLREYLDSTSNFFVVEILVSK